MNDKTKLILERTNKRLVPKDTAPGFSHQRLQISVLLLYCTIDSISLILFGICCRICRQISGWWTLNNFSSRLQLADFWLNRFEWQQRGHYGTHNLQYSGNEFSTNAYRKRPMRTDLYAAGKEVGLTCCITSGRHLMPAKCIFQIENWLLFVWIDVKRRAGDEKCCFNTVRNKTT